MGISNKLATKIRTAAKTEAVPLPRPYQDVGSLVAAAVIRAATSTIGQLKLTSSTARGRDFMGVRQSSSAHASTVSVSQRGQDAWLVALGVQTVSGWATDWQVRIVLADGPAGVTVNVTTPATLTRDGTLVNKSAHGELRDLVLSGLGAGVLPTGTAEVAVSKAGLAGVPLKPVCIPIAERTLRTRLRPDEIATAIAPVPFPVADRQPGAVSWRLGVAGALAGYFAQATIADDGATRTVELRCSPRPSDSPVTDALVAARGTALFGAVERALGRLDPGIERTAKSTDTKPADKKPGDR
jgi:hypothetical protein